MMNLMKFVGSIAGVLLFSSITFAASDNPVDLTDPSLEQEILNLHPEDEYGSHKVRIIVYGQFKGQNSQHLQQHNKPQLSDSKIINGEGKKDTALGLNWSIKPNLSVTADYATMHYSRFAIEVDDIKGSDELSLFQTRIQLRF